jgi:hypothetical protein
VAISNVGLATGVAKSTTASSQLKTFLCKYFYLCMSFLFAAIVIIGFSQTANANLFHANPPRPFLLWIHGAAFSAWVIFFMAQSALVRVRKVTVHRFLGWFGAGLAATMVVLGVTIAIIMGHFDTLVLKQKQTDVFPFLSVPLIDMFLFGACVALAIYLRKKPEFHRRLLFIATCQLLDAPFGRFDFIFNHNLFFPCLDALILLGLFRDWIVDNRIHKAYLYALPALIAFQSFAMYAYKFNPTWWQGITQAILG